MDDTKPIPWRGQKLNAKTILMLQSAERKLGFRLGLFQGSFCPGCVPDSGHTHDKGGVFDAMPPNSTDVVRILRKAGFAAYARHRPTFSTEHTHAVSLFDKDLHQEAKDQVKDYRHGGDALGAHTGDDDPGPRVDIPEHPTLERQDVRRRDIQFNKTSKSVGYLQDLLGAQPDEFFGDQTRNATRARLDWDGSSPLGLMKFLRFFPRDVFKRKTQLLPFM